MSCGKYLNNDEFTKQNDIINYFNYIKDKDCCNKNDCINLNKKKIKLAEDCERLPEIGPVRNDFCKEIRDNIHETRGKIHLLSSNEHSITSKSFGGKKRKGNVKGNVKGKRKTIRKSRKKQTRKH